MKQIAATVSIAIAVVLAAAFALTSAVDCGPSADQFQRMNGRRSCDH